MSLDESKSGNAWQEILVRKGGITSCRRTVRNEGVFPLLYSSSVAKNTDYSPQNFLCVSNWQNGFWTKMKIKDLFLGGTSELSRSSIMLDLGPFHFGGVFFRFDCVRHLFFHVRGTESIIVWQGVMSLKLLILPRRVCDELMESIVCPSQTVV